jgi:hypothetical protein
MSDWDDKRGSYKLDPNSDFVPELERRLKGMGLSKDATIILICRSGDRSAKAQDRLLMSGYTKVYGVAEGFEGIWPRRARRLGSVRSMAGRMLACLGVTSWTRQRCISRNNLFQG